MLVFVTMQSSLRAEHCFRTGFEEYIRNVAIPEHEHVAEAEGFQLAGSVGQLSYELSRQEDSSLTSTKHHISTLGILDLKLTHSVIGLDAHTPTDSRLDTLHLLVLCAIVRPQPPLFLNTAV